MRTYLLPRKISCIFMIVFVMLGLIHVTGICSLDTIRHGVPVFCPFEAITHIPCPGCGMTRAILSVAKGDLGSAIRYNPFSLFLLFMVAMSLLPERKMEKLPPRAAGVMRGFFILVLCSLLVYWVVFRVVPHIT